MADPAHEALQAAPLDQVETAVQQALDSGTDDHLQVLGYGEITLVIGWPAEAPAWACKRLPEFANPDALERYRVLFERYLEVLRARGVNPVPSVLRTTAAGHVAYVVQPVLPTGSQGPDVLRAATPESGERFLRDVFDGVAAVTDERVAIDGQISNWALVDGQLQYLDVTTPFLFDAHGRIELDLDLFLAAYPWAVRPPIRRFVAPGVIGAYRVARHTLVDLAANLLKERLDGWLPTAVALANEYVTPTITEAEVRRFYRSDARLWDAMLRLRRADRWWQRRVRRRTYPFLLPGPIER